MMMQMPNQLEVTAHRHIFPAQHPQPQPPHVIRPLCAGHQTYGLAQVQCSSLGIYTQLLAFSLICKVLYVLGLLLPHCIIQGW